MSIFGGIDARRFDTRSVVINRTELDRICLGFRLGQLRGYTSDHKLSISHSNVIFFVKTSRGDFVFKLHSLRNTNVFYKELILNRYLLKHGFPVSTMYSASGRKPFFSINGYLVTCYRHLDGYPLYLGSLGLSKLRKINSSIYKLNRFLSDFSRYPRLSRWLEFESLAEKIHQIGSVLKIKQKIVQRDLITSCFRKLIRVYEDEAGSFLKCPIHPNLSLSNFLFSRGELYLLDLAHVRFDYRWSDLANLAVSCYFFDIPDKKIAFLRESYGKHYSLNKKSQLSFFYFVLLRLINEYLKITTRENDVIQVLGRAEGIDVYMHEIKKRRNKIIHLLQKFIGRI